MHRLGSHMAWHSKSNITFRCFLRWESSKQGALLTVRMRALRHLFTQGYLSLNKRVEIFQSLDILVVGAKPLTAHRIGAWDRKVLGRGGGMSNHRWMKTSMRRGH